MHRCRKLHNDRATVFDWLVATLPRSTFSTSDSVERRSCARRHSPAPPSRSVSKRSGEVLAWKLPKGRDEARRVVKTFMFTDIVSSTGLAELLGDEAWTTLLRWHDETLRALFATHRGQEVVATGDGFFIGFDSPDDALACAVAIQRTLAAHRRDHGFAPQVRIGIHLADATQVGQNYQGMGVNQASRIASVAGGSEIVASTETVAGTKYRTSEQRSVDLKGISKPVDVVSIEWQ